MAKAELKTKKNRRSVEEFLARVTPKEKREDCLRILQLMKAATKQRPQMWGASIVGFGTYRYTYPSGREGEWFVTGFSPRKQNLTLYFIYGFGHHRELMARLGKYKTGRSCLYVNSLGDINVPVLQKLIEESVRITPDQAGQTAG